jgi:hypothetical protein
LQLRKRCRRHGPRELEPSYEFGLSPGCRGLKRFGLRVLSVLERRASGVRRSLLQSTLAEFQLSPSISKLSLSVGFQTLSGRMLPSSKSQHKSAPHDERVQIPSETHPPSCSHYTVPSYWSSSHISMHGNLQRLRSYILAASLHANTGISSELL